MLKKLFRYGAIVSIALGCTFGVTTLAAQDVTPEPTPAPVTPFPEVPPVEDLGTVVLSPLVTVILSLAGSAFGVAIIGILKQVPLFSSLSGDTLKYLVGGIILAVVLLARNFGYETQLDASLKFATQLITIVASLLTSFKGMQAVYNQAVKREIPIVGYKRT